VDPLFVDPENGDYHLTECSPCIDAGNPNSPFDPDGTIADMGAFYYDQLNEVNDNVIQIVEYDLYNFPNPFNPTTTISLTIQEESNIELSLYNIKGQKIRSLLNNQITAGEHSIVWNGEDDSGKKVGSGVYLYKLHVNDKIELVKKCLLLK
ncbi:MAG: FlgD immunoglobulin-like domain containing protein, partial [Candidatus Tenebribacter davisii]|nr:FlgD immunoglobulin-like domain containing protein [Candidatus Tenebribacter davisii]